MIASRTASTTAAEEEGLRQPEGRGGGLLLPALSPAWMLPLVGEPLTTAPVMGPEPLHTGMAGVEASLHHSSPPSRARRACTWITGAEGSAFPPPPPEQPLTSGGMDGGAKEEVGVQAGLLGVSSQPWRGEATGAGGGGQRGTAAGRKGQWQAWPVGWEQRASPLARARGEVWPRWGSRNPSPTSAWAPRGAGGGAGPGGALLTLLPSTVFQAGLLPVIVVLVPSAAAIDEHLAGLRLHVKMPPGEGGAAGARLLRHSTELWVEKSGTAHPHLGRPMPPPCGKRDLAGLQGRESGLTFKISSPLARMARL